MTEVLMRCLESPKVIGEFFNMRNSRAVTTVYTLATRVILVLHSKSEIIFVPPLSADIQLYIPNTDKAQEIPNFKAQVELKEWILRTAE